MLQLEALQLLQELPVPAIEEYSPSPPLEKEAKRERIRLAVFLHLGHEVSSLALLKGRNSSNLQVHSGQRYS